MNARMLCRLIKVSKLNDYCMRIRSQSLCKRNLILNFRGLTLLITTVFTQSLKRNHQSSICSRYIEPTAGSLPIGLGG
ncbi:unnamed protein product [Prunus armeniaca]|uniref:Uncharacterized protein n=1 Tax=Prunus armeniaca TaxID=36596 RepID=A0A6J5VDA3_PRUAR|nr:unnamed protein product [Prunus armeniaca]CAB4286182.1 unnamed protein product [Prunus armeniaca]